MNRRFFSFFFSLFPFAVIAILALLPGCGSPVRNLDSKGSTIICFGDSITYGQGAAKDEAYPARLQAMVSREVINAGVSGDTTRDALGRVEEDVLEEDPYLVVVEFGANDHFTEIPEEETAANLRRIIAMIQDGGAIVAVCDVSAGASIIGEFDIYHDKLERLARETGSVFIPYLMKGILQKPSLRSDHMHPNAEGYRIIAERVYEKIKPYL